MKSISRFGVIAALAIGMAPASVFAGNVTVGRFYTELARAKRLPSADAAAAEANLRGAGFKLPSLALDNRLTEGDMVSISSLVGVLVTTHRPAQPIDESLLNTYMAVFGNQLRHDGQAKGNPYSLYSGGNGQGGNNQGGNNQGGNNQGGNNDNQGGGNEHSRSRP
jgi:hypothetical protein